jgi:ferrochelatase
LKIETLVNLIGGELLNSPYISEVTSFTDEPEKVQRGSCFFVKNSSDIDRAVQNGAYAIVSENYEEIKDNEIAWIKVTSLKKAVVDVFKYENLKTKIHFCDEITEHIIDKMNVSSEVVVLKDYEDLLKALNLGRKLLVTSDEKFKEFFSNVEVLLPKKIDLEKKTLFKSLYLNHEINLPFVYREEFGRAVKFFEDNCLKYSLEFTLDRFKPVFVDYKFRKVEYGESEKVLISGIKNDRYFFKELNYLIDSTKHAKTVIVNEENREILKEGFNFAMLVDFEIDFSPNKKEESLFD